jgi:hypothetical protein
MRGAARGEWAEYGTHARYGSAFAVYYDRLCAARRLLPVQHHLTVHPILRVAWLLRSAHSGGRRRRSRLRGTVSSTSVSCRMVRINGTRVYARAAPRMSRSSLGPLHASSTWSRSERTSTSVSRHSSRSPCPVSSTQAMVLIGWNEARAGMGRSLGRMSGGLPGSGPAVHAPDRGA